MAEPRSPVGQAVGVMVIEEQAGQQHQGRETMVAPVHPAAVVMVRAVVVGQEPLALLELHQAVVMAVLGYRIV